jgi:hypothetical protein
MFDLAVVFSGSNFSLAPTRRRVVLEMASFGQNARLRSSHLNFYRDPIGTPSEGERAKIGFSGERFHRILTTTVAEM